MSIIVVNIVIIDIMTINNNLYDIAFKPLVYVCASILLCMIYQMSPFNIINMIINFICQKNSIFFSVFNYYLIGYYATVFSIVFYFKTYQNTDTNEVRLLFIYMMSSYLTAYIGFYLWIFTLNLIEPDVYHTIMIMGLYLILSPFITPIIVFPIINLFG